MVGKLRVAVADDHQLVVDAVCAALEEDDDIEVVAAATSGRRLLALLAQTSPDVVLLDLVMPELDGLACLAVIRERFPRVKVVMLSGVDDPRAVHESLQFGASAFARKTLDPRDLVAVLRQTVEETVVSQAAMLVDQDEEEARACLTRSELAVLDLLARGMMNKQIAAELSLAQQTVKFHLTNVYRKLGVSNRTEAIRFAYEHGLSGGTKTYAYA
jgi:DNA-binding NarL/FixJ family response regulator